jgi:hypothetical protein
MTLRQDLKCRGNEVMVEMLKLCREIELGKHIDLTNHVIQPDSNLSVSTISLFQSHQGLFASFAFCIHFHVAQDPLWLTHLMVCAIENSL